jgi:hypothetical protein
MPLGDISQGKEWYLNLTFLSYLLSYIFLGVILCYFMLIFSILYLNLKKYERKRDYKIHA